jgi:4-nitrophenyl phosphatase
MDVDLSKIRALILDMDGVLWRQTTPIGDLPSIFKKIENAGLKVALATNNATFSIAEYLEKLAGFGVYLHEDQIINSSQAALHYLSDQYPAGGRLYIVGEKGLVDTLAKGNFSQAETDVLAVVVGMDRQLTWEKLSKATLLIRAGAGFIGTNADRTFPVPEGLIPGVGAVLGALEIASGQKPIVLGKPAPEIYRIALKRLGLGPEQALVVGDRLETDIQGAQRLGCKTALVLSGVTSFQAAQAWKPAPDWIVSDLTSLLDDVLVKAIR